MSAASPATEDKPGAGRISAYKAAVSDLEAALASEKTSTMQLQKLLQRQQDQLAALQTSTTSGSSATGSKDPLADEEATDDSLVKIKRKRTIRSMRKAKATLPSKERKPKTSRKDILAMVQALLELDSSSEESGVAPKVTARATHPRSRKVRVTRRPPSTTSDPSAEESTEEEAGRVRVRVPLHTPPPTPPSSLDDDSLSSSDSGCPSEEEALPLPPVRRSRLRRRPVTTRVTHEVYDRRLAIHTTNRLFKNLLKYKTYFLRDTSLAYPPVVVGRTYKTNQAMDGCFQGQAPFTGKDPLAIFTFL